MAPGHRLAIEVLGQGSSRRLPQTDPMKLENRSLNHENPAKRVSPTPNIGIAAVTPSYFLHDILFSDELKKFRADHPIVEPPQEPQQPGK
jgi:hypothetical protein